MNGPLMSPQKRCLHSSVYLFDPTVQPVVGDRQLEAPYSTHKSSLRTSIWLFDPTEVALVPPTDDVKIRPIAQALYEIRQVQQDRVKMQLRKKRQAVSKNVTRSRYYGPTESSRHARWLEQQTQQHPSKPANLDTKIIANPTKLMNSQKAEFKMKSPKASHRSVSLVKHQSQAFPQSLQLPSQSPLEKVEDTDILFDDSKIRCNSAREPFPSLSLALKSENESNIDEGHSFELAEWKDVLNYVELENKEKGEELDSTVTSDIEDLLDYFEGVVLPI